MQVSKHTAFTNSPGSTLVRLLDRLAEVQVPESDRSISERLSHWLRWTDAISLSSVLTGGVAAPAPSARAPAGAGTAEAIEVDRVRTALLKALAEDGAAPGAVPVSLSAATDFAPYRRRYVARQQAMETGIGPLRGRLRSALAGRSAAMARLAAVDLVMEQALGAHEQRVLANVPVLLEKHFNRLRRAQVDPTERIDGDVDVDAPPDAWRAGFAKDMHSVLAAELDIRMQPVEALLEALHAR